MQKTIIILIVLCFGFFSQAQKVKEKDLIGTWKLIIDIEKEMEDEAEEADTFMEELILGMVSGFVGGVMEDIDIYFDFKENNKLKITVHAYDETETEYGSWKVNQRGFLEITDLDQTHDNLHIDAEDDEWMFIDGLLVSEEHKDSRSVYMTKVN